LRRTLQRRDQNGTITLALSCFHFATAYKAICTFVLLNAVSMKLSRRAFCELTVKSFLVISGSKVLQSFAPANVLLPSAKKLQLRFALASDGHYGQPETEYDLFHNEMLGWLQKEKQQRGLDFTIVNGDLFHNDASFLPKVKSVWDKLGMPYYVSHGNHDMVTDAVWRQTWSTPYNHSFTKGENAFVVLNTADDKGTYICPDVAYTREQLSKYASYKNLFVIMHITPVKWTGAGIDCPEIVEMFSQQKNLRGIFHGHDHNEDDMKEKGGKHFFFDSHVAGNWGTAYRGYRIVEVMKTGEIITYQYNPAMGLKVNDNQIKLVNAG